MKKTVKAILVGALTLGLGVGAVNAQTISISPTGSVKIGGDNDGGVGKGRETAPGQMKKEYGGSATDYAPGQQKKGGGSTLTFGDDKNGKEGKSKSQGKGNAGGGNKGGKGKNK